MHTIIWEFQVRPGSEEEFERVYGPRGDWAGLFDRANGYLGTELLRDEGREGHYITIDRWISEAAFKSLRELWRAEYEEMDRECESLTERESLVGSFSSIDS